MPTLPQINSFTDFGGLKVDYSPIVDSSTDRSAGQINAALCDVAMMSHCSPRGFVVFQGSSTPTLLDYDFVWLTSTTTQPIISYIGVGQYGITLPQYVQDELGNTHPVQIRCTWGTVIPSDPSIVTGLCTMTCAPIDPYTLLPASNIISVFVWKPTIFVTNNERITVFFI